MVDTRTPRGPLTAQHARPDSPRAKPRGDLDHLVAPQPQHENIVGRYSRGLQATDPLKRVLPALPARPIAFDHRGWPGSNGPLGGDRFLVCRHCRVERFDEAIGCREDAIRIPVVQSKHSCAAGRLDPELTPAGAPAVDILA